MFAKLKINVHYGYKDQKEMVKYVNLNINHNQK